MQFQITNISGGVNVDSATVQLQEVRADAPDDGSATPTPLPISTMQLIVPLTEARKYSIGDNYEVTLDAVSAASTKGKR